jgi:hypothetical protein
MDPRSLTRDFREFLQLLNDHGVDFAECYLRRELTNLDGVTVQVISLEDLKANKRASGRNKDLADLDELP